jgi:hypothetical protein
MSSVERHIRYNNTASLDIPEWYITKIEKEPIHGGFPPDNVAQIPPKPLSIQRNDAKGSAT